MPITPEAFEALSPAGKGYVVYFLGCHADEPNVPETYTPAPEDRAEFDRGQAHAILAVQDCP